MIVRRNPFFPILRMIALIVAGLAVALVVALSQVNLDTLRSSIVAVLQDATGMPVQVDGGVSWKLSLRPRIELNDVRIANADWAKNKYAYSADKIDVRLNLVSLFHDRPTIQNIKMYDVKVNIDLLGSRISTKEKDMVLEYIVYDKETRKILKESEVEVELND